MVYRWIEDFQAANRLPDEDVVFDVLCGDFNFDNCSPGVCVSFTGCSSIIIFDEYLPNVFFFILMYFLLECLDDALEQNHFLFENYKDPCRAGPGKEKPWAIGQCYIYKYRAQYDNM